MWVNENKVSIPGVLLGMMFPPLEDIRFLGSICIVRLKLCHFILKSR